MTVWLLVAMFATGPIHYEVYAKKEACEAQAARFSKDERTIAYCAKRLVTS